jgi:tRNA modification GTPase
MTFMSCLTPPGRAAIATLAIRGPQAWGVTREVFTSKRALPAVPECGRLWLGHIGHAGAADTVVLSVHQLAPVPWLELHCHGGAEIVRLVTESFEERGVRSIPWPEFLRLTGDEPSRVLARILLAQAPTVRTASVLLDQMHGALDHAIQRVREAIEADNLPHAANLLSDLLRHAAVGRHLVQPWKIVVAGPPNVGKSSLVNALAGHQRSVVSPVPGTTRDVVTTLMALDGWPVEVSDTAGWRSASEPLESAGIDLARAAAANADLCLWLLDASTTPELPPFSAGRVRLVINKTDLPSAWDASAIPHAARVSATRGDDIPELCDFLARTLVPDAPPPGAAVPFDEPLIDCLHTALDRCREGQGAAALQALRTR